MRLPILRAAGAATALLALGCPDPEPALQQGDGTVDMSLAAADVVGIPNIDDDNLDGDPDWDDEDIDEDDDVTRVTFVEGTFPKLKDGEQVRFTLAGDRRSIRVWHGGRVVLGNRDGERIREWSVSEEPSELFVEFREFLTAGTLYVEHLAEDGERKAGSEVELLASPLIVHTHMGTATEVWAVDEIGNEAFIEGYEDALGDRFQAASGRTYGRDPWMQDEVEYASVTAPGQDMEIVIDSIRDRGLVSFAEREIVGAGSARGVWGDPAGVTSQDSFGNLEVTPPVTVDGVSYPFGRVYYGYPGEQVGQDDWWVGTVASELRDFLDEQQIQKPFEVDVGWLCVGHVDEYISWVPDVTAPKGFRMLIADTTTAWELLEGMDPSTRLTRYASEETGHGYATVGEILSDTRLRRDNEEVQERIDAALAQFQREAGIDAEDVVYVPDIFEQVPGYGGCYAAMVPGMVNLIVANFGEGDEHLFMADPFVRTSLSDPAADPFIGYMHDVLPDQFELHFLDDWASYHMGLGEVHCGSNVRREPAGDWWNSAAPLLEIDR